VREDEKRIKAEESYLAPIRSPSAQR